MEERLQKFLASSGVASRRKSEELIMQGKIKVNGVVVTELGTKINTEKDKIEYNGQLLNKPNKKLYILLNKPIGYVTTSKDQFGRDTVMDLVKGVNERLVAVGRLDMYTSGALILTNDGEFVNRVTHPSNEIEKTYNVTIGGKITEKEITTLKNGVEIDLSQKNYSIENNNIINNDKVKGKKLQNKGNGHYTDVQCDLKEPFKTLPAKVKILKIDNEKNISRIQITIHEGKNREVRKMCEAIGKKVLALHRSKIGNIDVKNLKLGTWRYLKQNEIERLIK